MTRATNAHVRMACRSTSKCLILFSILFIGLLGCHNYVPTDFTTVPVGEDVRLTVTRQSVPDLSEVSLENDPVPVLEGTLERRQDGSLIVRIPVGRRADGFHSVALGPVSYTHLTLPTILLV